ncbi:DUF2024 family protein [Lacimicrobium alkaliphilum]|uniref:DUF2024 domain-containing protein n=1 Tax=Lacimicrobium alkaliphilum TaxID=1526571 RepID=A0ABQ1R9D6_9ALTE|nr:DUF2024 family protein [Lacimicrobium alkaliphilum]GGD61214.1 hypothetical protein GCM10011357_15680 [Lacimicrobium alkaliphilum]
MQVHVYDTHVHTSAGQYLHFDVLVDDSNVGQVKQFAQDYLTSLGVTADKITQSRCNFCHSEIANPEVALAIENNGHSILVL